MYSDFRDIKLHNPQLVQPENFTWSQLISTPQASWVTYPILMRSRKGHLLDLFSDFFITEKKHGKLLYPMFHHHLVMNLSEYLGDAFFWQTTWRVAKNSQIILWRLFKKRLQDASLCSCKYLHFGQSFIRWCRSWFALGTLRWVRKKKRRFYLRASENEGDGTTVDGWNIAPVGMVNVPLFTEFYTSQVVQDFFHQQYGLWSCVCWFLVLEYDIMCQTLNNNEGRAFVNTLNSSDYL